MTKIKIFFSVIFAFSAFFGIHKDASAVGCQVIDANFRTGPGVPYPTNDFTVVGNEPVVYIDIKTVDCIGSSIQLSITSPVYSSLLDILTAAGPQVQIPDPNAPATTWYYDDLENFDNIPISVTQNDFTIAARATAEECAAYYGDWDCQYQIITWDSDSPSNGEFWETEYTEDDVHIPNMMLLYDCFGSFACELDPPSWTRVMEDPALPGNEQGIFPYGFLHSLDQFNEPNSALTPIEPSEDFLAPLPGLSNNACANPPCSKLGNFLRGFFTLLIVIAGLLAFIMIVIGGITYATSDAFSGKSAGKDMIINAVIGLILALGGWVILNSINPNLASNLGINIPKVYLDNYNFSEPGVVSTTGGSACKNPPPPPNCPTCQAIPSPVVVESSGTTVVPGMVTKLVNFKNASGDFNWAVTEAFPPSHAHCSPEHYTGNTVDANFRAPSSQSNPTNADIRQFIDVAKAHGLRAVYETNSATRFNELVAAGFTRRSEVLLWSAITAPHFSVYNR